MANDDMVIPKIDLSQDSQVMETRAPAVLNTPSDTMQNSPQQVAPNRRRIQLPRLRLNKKKVTVVGGVLAAFLIAFLVLAVLPVYGLYQKGKVLAAAGEKLQVAVQEQNIGKIKTELDGVQKELISFQGSLRGLGWTKAVPFVGAYYKDGDAAIKAGLLGLEAAKEMVVTVEPYADIIGFTGDPSKQAQSGQENANDRIEFLIQTIGQIAPKLDSISEKAVAAKAELATIDPDRYPEDFRGTKVREKMKKVLHLADEATSIISEGKPLLQMAPFFLGIESPRTYLVLFQNDKELRATGGFLTAYSIMKVDKGKLSPVASSDIYALDGKYKPAIEAPEEFRSFIKGPYSIAENFYIRDLNWWPDFKVSMDAFSKEAKTAGVNNIDGIIAVDTHVLVKILNVLGQIGVPGFGNFSTAKDDRCDCPNVIYELENFADVEGPVVWSENEPGKIVFAPKNYGKNRKEIVGPLMNSVLANALGQPKEKLPDLFQAGFEAVTEKHVLLYMFDPKAQEAVENFGIAGRIDAFDADYLHVNDSNLGGRKSNLYVTQEVHQEYSTAKDGSIEKTVTITYKNPKEHDGWLNSVLPNWTRVYVPKGSQLIETEGFEVKKDPYEEFDKTVFAGGFKLRPQGVAKIILKYKLPFKSTGELPLLVQKQPGTDMPLFTISAGRQKEELFLKSDQEFKLKI